MILRSKDRETLLRIFSAIEIPVEVWAYGSRVAGTAHEGSDLDLVLKSNYPKGIPIDSLTAIRQKITESNIPILVELHDWGRLPASFQRNIEEQHELLFSNIVAVVNEPPPSYKKGNKKGS